MATMPNTDVVTRGDLDTFRVGVPLGRVARSEEIADMVAFPHLRQREHPHHQRAWWSTPAARSGRRGGAKRTARFD
jgi:hypothetical protein